jgi:glucose/arabinose dehydrogenase
MKQRTHNHCAQPFSSLDRAMERGAMSVLVFLFFNLTIHADSLKLKEIFPKNTFERPVGFLEADHGDHVYVIEQRGKIWNCVSGEKKSLVMDISKRLGSANEEGLLCAVKSPDFKVDKQVYLYYSNKTPRKSVIARFTLEQEHHRIDLSSEEKIIEIPEPYANHNGGQLAFGPDRMLYVGVGDGGAAGDPKLYGQDLGNVHGSILRLDVLGTSTYNIPPDNPFVHLGGKVNSEIFACGLRNPWRFSFDLKTGEIWCGDVGQNKFEEINIIKPGQNYGWNLREGTDAYISVRRNKSKKSSSVWRISTEQTKSADFVEPIFTYPRSDGLSVTGGYVYRGNAIPHLQGWYVCSDFVSGKHWLLNKKRGQIKTSVKINDHHLQVSSYAQDSEGELYMMSFKDGTVYKIVDWLR